MSTDHSAPFIPILPEEGLAVDPAKLVHPTIPPFAGTAPINACDTLLKLSRRFEMHPVYDVSIRIAGPDHCPTFYTTVRFLNNISSGTSSSKQGSRRSAAHAMVQYLEKKYEKFIRAIPFFEDRDGDPELEKWAEEEEKLVEQQSLAVKEHALANKSDIWEKGGSSEDTGKENKMNNDPIQIDKDQTSIKSHTAPRTSPSSVTQADPGFPPTARARGEQNTQTFPANEIQEKKMSNPEAEQDKHAQNDEENGALAVCSVAEDQQEKRVALGTNADQGKSKSLADKEVVNDADTVRGPRVPDTEPLPPVTRRISKKQVESGKARKHNPASPGVHTTIVHNSDMVDETMAPGSSKELAVQSDAVVRSSAGGSLTKDGIGGSENSNRENHNRENGGILPQLQTGMVKPNSVAVKVSSAVNNSCEHEAQVAQGIVDPSVAVVKPCVSIPLSKPAVVREQKASVENGGSNAEESLIAVNEQVGLGTRTDMPANIVTIVPDVSQDEVMGGQKELSPLRTRSKATKILPPLIGRKSVLATEDSIVQDVSQDIVMAGRKVVMPASTRSKATNNLPQPVVGKSAHADMVVTTSDGSHEELVGGQKIVASAPARTKAMKVLPPRLARKSTLTVKEHNVGAKKIPGSSSEILGDEASADVVFLSTVNEKNARKKTSRQTSLIAVECVVNLKTEQKELELGRKVSGEQNKSIVEHSMGNFDFQKEQKECAATVAQDSKVAEETRTEEGGINKRSTAATEDEIESEFRSPAPPKKRRTSISESVCREVNPVAVTQKRLSICFKEQRQKSGMPLAGKSEIALDHVGIPQPHDAEALHKRGRDEGESAGLVPLRKRSKVMLPSVRNKNPEPLKIFLVTDLREKWAFDQVNDFIGASVNNVEMKMFVLCDESCELKTGGCVKEFHEIKCSQMDPGSADVVLSFEAGRRHEMMWIARAHHSKEGGLKELNPRMIIVGGSDFLSALQEPGVVDFVKEDGPTLMEVVKNICQSATAKLQ